MLPSGCPLTLTNRKPVEEITCNLLSSILHGKRSITADTALRLGKYFGNSPRFWLGLQADYDLEEEQKAIQSELDTIPTVPAPQD